MDVKALDGEIRKFTRHDLQFHYPSDYLGTISLDPKFDLKFDAHNKFRLGMLHSQNNNSNEIAKLINPGSQLDNHIYDLMANQFASDHKTTQQPFWHTRKTLKNTFLNSKKQQIDNTNQNLNSDFLSLQKDIYNTPCSRVSTPSSIYVPRSKQAIRPYFYGSLPGVRDHHKIQIRERTLKKLAKMDLKKIHQELHPDNHSSTSTVASASTIKPPELLDTSVYGRKPSSSDPLMRGGVPRKTLATSIGQTRYVDPEDAKKLPQPVSQQTKAHQFHQTVKERVEGRQELKKAYQQTIDWLKHSTQGVQVPALVGRDEFSRGVTKPNSIVQPDEGYATVLSSVHSSSLPKISTTKYMAGTGFEPGTHLKRALSQITLVPTIKECCRKRRTQRKQQHTDNGFTKEEAFRFLKSGDTMDAATTEVSTVGTSWTCSTCFREFDCDCAETRTTTQSLANRKNTSMDFPPGATLSTEELLRIAKERDKKNRAEALKRWIAESGKRSLVKPGDTEKDLNRKKKILHDLGRTPSEADLTTLSHDYEELRGVGDLGPQLPVPCSKHDLDRHRYGSHSMVDLRDARSLMTMVKSRKRKKKPCGKCGKTRKTKHDLTSTVLQQAKIEDDGN